MKENYLRQVASTMKCRKYEKFHQDIIFSLQFSFICRCIFSKQQQLYSYVGNKLLKSLNFQLSLSIASWEIVYLRLSSLLGQPLTNTDRWISIVAIGACFWNFVKILKEINALLINLYLKCIKIMSPISKLLKLGPLILPDLRVFPFIRENYGQLKVCSSNLASKSCRL